MLETCLGTAIASRKEFGAPAYKVPLFTFLCINVNVEDVN